MSRRERKGMVHVYTGGGKGKTTAALGLALRAWGHGRRVLIIQFMKGRSDYGELLAAQRMPGFAVEHYGRPEFVNPENPAPQDLALAARALARAREAVASGEYDVVVLDEVNVALGCGLVALADVLAVVAARPPALELILTGRDAPPALVDAADVVTEMREVKHPFRKGVAAREGVEY